MTQTLKRLLTGIDGLDALLKGGLVTGASYIVQGPPGAGKTILANQMACEHVRKGGRALVATLLSESHERLFQYLGTLDFFDPSMVGDQIQFVSAFDTLEQDGLDAVVRLLRQEISRHKASLLIVDGVLNARVHAETSLDTKKFVSALQGHAAFAGCTVLLLTSARLEEGSPEHTMVDGVIELGEQMVGSRAVRTIQLRKTRGSGALSGRHECLIDDTGVTVFPRLESLFAKPIGPCNAAASRISSGVSALDDMLDGGLSAASVTLLMGPSGIGKTSLGMAFLAASTPQAPGLHFGFYESPDRLHSKAALLGYDFAAMEQAQSLTLCWEPSTQVLLDQLGARLIEQVQATGAKRVLIDSLGALSRLATEPGRLNAFFRALTGELRARQVSVMLTWEMRDIFGAEISAPAPDLSSIVDNLVLMRFVEHDGTLRRMLSILKVRDSAHDASLHELVIASTGITLRRAFEGTSGALSGTAVPQGSL
ncbi:MULTISPECIES: ATPase domain-containing protein [Pseudomonas]|uniref:non-specific serine/threonine protein kinase n=1 Tax=Pseudomonas parafulva TaxID=157782 RepID=A0AAJ0PFV9_9PSED|nr:MULTISPECIES: ATPase domain-containing protein [Pseudomonas]KTT19030.1 serine/threonine protein kinase [Pseudomonas parafulva]MBF8635973.1 serine/threonine protein kinase [Pseudomonas fulva]MBF8688174.1 serine/threonine protein kinase [Pseudomonas fulva]MBF8764290.1 serine/threonine protein kinase [Pseudomonas putida]MEC4022079.1 ATPase domain-containing protein [Pseudomonas fulva]